MHFETNILKFRYTIYYKKGYKKNNLLQKMVNRKIIYKNIYEIDWFIIYKGSYHIENCF